MSTVTDLNQERRNRRAPTYGSLDHALVDAQSKLLALIHRQVLDPAQTELRDDLSEIYMILRACHAHIADPQQHHTS